MITPEIVTGILGGSALGFGILVAMARWQFRQDLRQVNARSKSLWAQQVMENAHGAERYPHCDDVPPPDPLDVMFAEDRRETDEFIRQLDAELTGIEWKAIPATIKEHGVEAVMRAPDNMFADLRRVDHAFADGYYDGL